MTDVVNSDGASMSVRLRPTSRRKRGPKTVVGRVSCLGPQVTRTYGLEIVVRLGDGASNEGP